VGRIAAADGFADPDMSGREWVGWFAPLAPASDPAELDVTAPPLAAPLLADAWPATGRVAAEAALLAPSDFAASAT
jgi:hypothetical protein